MNSLKFFALILFLSCSLLASGQRYKANLEMTCRKSGKPVLMYDHDFLKVGMSVSPDIVGYEGTDMAGFTNKGFVVQAGLMRYFDLDLNVNQFGIGWYAPFTASVNFWETDDFNSIEGLQYNPYVFLGVGVGPLFSTKVVGRVILDLYANVNPTLSYYGGAKYTIDDVDYKEYSFIAAMIGFNYGAQLRYRTYMVGFEIMPGRARYNIHSYADNEAIPESPFKRKSDVTRVNCTIGYCF
jgi:hypothetical protein